MIKHTQGPWKWDDDFTLIHENNQQKPEEGSCAVILSSECEVVPGDRSLIAAAPELLEACKLVRRNLDPLYSSGHLCMVKLDAAIAKAEGK